MTSKKHSVVIVGGGLSGARAAKLLASDALYDVTLISDSFFLNYHPQLYRTNSERTKLQLHIKLQDIFHGRGHDLDLVRAKITQFSPEKNLVRSDKGIDYKYDSLILALGREARPIDGFKSRNVYSAYQFDEMTRLRRRIVSDFESGKPAQSYAVVGAGLTGVELAAEIQHLAKQMAAKYNVDPNSYKVLLLESESVILPEPTMSKDVRKIVLKRLKELGVIISVGTEAKGVNENDGLETKEKGTFEDSVVVLAAGQVVNRFFIKNRNKFSLDRDTYVNVTDLMEAEGYSNVYPIGDCASTEDSGYVSTGLYDAEFVTKTIHGKIYAKKVHVYQPPTPTLTIPVGRKWAVYEDLPKILTGNRGWLHKRWIDLKHFSTLLTKRQLTTHWLFGSNGDEIS